MITGYDGHTYKLASGTTVHHRVLLDHDGSILLDITSPFGGVLAASLSPDEAMKLATTLLRDVSLLRFGSG